jgi:hypothetical protein
VTIAMKQVSSKLLYLTTFCNFPHRKDNGHPVNHECYILHPKALAAEIAGDFSVQPFRTDRILSPNRVEVVNETSGAMNDNLRKGHA